MNKGNEDLWGFEVRKRTMGYLQLLLIERGLDWVYLLGVWILVQVLHMHAKT